MCQNLFITFVKFSAIQSSKPRKVDHSDQDPIICLWTIVNLQSLPSVLWIPLARTPSGKTTRKLYFLLSVNLRVLANNHLQRAPGKICQPLIHGVTTVKVIRCWTLEVRVIYSWRRTLETINLIIYENAQCWRWRPLVDTWVQRLYPDWSVSHMTR